MNISVSRVRPDAKVDGAHDEIDEIARLQSETFTNPWSADSLRWEIENTDVARLYVLRVDGALVGFCACWVILDELHINSLAIAHAWRRKGLASRLLREVCRDARESGATQATLEVRRSNTAALALYESLGFTSEGVRADYYQSPREDALVLWCRNLAATRSLW
jgi:ribosomal-protein-alanine N-acetyltransferase